MPEDVGIIFGYNYAEDNIFLPPIDVKLSLNISMNISTSNAFELYASSDITFCTQIFLILIDFLDQRLAYEDNICH